MSEVAITSVFAGIALTVAVFELLRRKYLREKYAFIWFAFGTFITASLIFPKLLMDLSSLLGFHVFSNFVFAVFVAALIFFVMQLSMEISKAERDVERLAEEIAILKSYLDVANKEK